MAIFTLQDLRSQVSEEYANKSDEELVLEYARGTGQDPFKVASKFGVETGMGRSAFTSGASAGVDQVQAMAAGAGAAVAEALGATGLRNTLESEVRSQQAQAALAINPEVPQRIEDVEGIGDFGSYFAGQVGQQVPIMGGILAAGAATGWLGLGAGVGSLAAGYTYGVGSLYNESVEGGERDAAGALLGGIPYAAAEAAVPFALGRAVRGLGAPGVAATREINLAGGGATTTVPTTAIGRGGRAFVGGAVAEGATEAFQTELEIGMRDDLSPEEIASRRLNAVVSGALVGGGFSGVVNAAFKPKDAQPTEKDISTPEDILRYKEQYIEEQRRLRSKPILTEEQLDEQVEAIAADTNGLEELEKLAKQRMNSREREATRLELKAAQEKLAELNQSIPESEELFTARERLAKLEAESSPDIGKRTRGREAAKLRKQAEQRAQETAEERRDLEIAIASMEFDQRNEYSDQGAQLLALEFHIDKLNDVLEADARGKAARKALVRVRKGRLTPEQGQAQVGQAEADRQASLEAASQPVEEAAPVTTVATEQEQAPAVEPTSPIVEPAADEMFTVARDVGGVNLVEDIAYGDLTAEEKASRQVQDEIKRRAAEPVAEPRGEVVQTTAPEEELVTEEDVVASDQKAADAVNKLNADVKSDKTKVAGRITIDQPVIAAAARFLRNPSPTAKPVIYETGTANPVAMTDAEIAQLTEIREAALRVAAANARYSNSASNIINRARGTDADIDALDVAQAEANIEKRDALRQELVAAVKRFTDAAGGPQNANAIIAAYKATKEKSGRGNPSRDLTQKEADFINSIIPSRKGKFSKLGGYTTTFDTLLSSAFNQYVNGKLQTLPDIAPSGLDIRANKSQQAKEKKAGIRLFEKDLQEVVARGKLANNLTEMPDTSVIDTAETEALDDLVRLREGKELKEGEKKLTKGEYLKRRADVKQKATVARAELEAYREDILRATKGVEALVNRALDSGTRNVTERLFAKMIRRALAARKKAGIAEPTIKFDPKESSFDPKTNTITLARETSPEVVLHEVLHALLQGYVYNNRSNQVIGADKDVVRTVDVLRGYVRALVNLDLDSVQGLSQSERKASTQVINTLKNILNQGGTNAEVDAVLELISYGNTLRDFKTMLTKIGQVRSEANRTWKAVLEDIWAAINTLLNKLIGRPANDSAANDILTASIELLQGATKKPQQAAPVGRYGKKLFSGAPSTQQQVDVDLQEYGKQGTYGLTKPLFTLLGKALPADMPSKLKTLASEVREAVIKAFPGSEKVLRGFNPMLAFGEQLKKVFQTFKNEKHTGVQLAELVSNHLRDLIQRDLASAQKFIAYLDGDKTALDGVPESKLMKTRADNLLEAFETFKTALPESYKQFFDGRKFSESLIFVEKESDIGSGSVGQRKLSQIFGGRKQDLEKSDNPEWLGLDQAGAVFDSDAVYYRVVGATAGRSDHGKTIGFVREDIANAAGGVTIDNEAGESFPIDMNVKWSGKDVAGGKFQFTSNKTIADALRDGNKMEAADQIGIAILNTANTLGTYYSSKRFFSGLANLGRDANGEFDQAAFERGEVPVVFDSVDQYNEYLEQTAADGETVRPFDPERVAVASASELKSGLVAGELRRTGTLVRIPDTQALKDQGLPIKVWGELAGKVVHGPVYAAIVDMSSKHTLFDKGVMRTYNDALRQFKLSKTTRNPGTHITNVASNVTIMMMHGITFKTLRRAADVMYKAARNPDALTDADLRILKEFEKSGALLGNFSASEVKKERYRTMRDKIKPEMDDKGVPGRVAQLLQLESDTAKSVGNWLADKDKKMLELYAAEDNVFRLAAFMNRAGELQADNNGQQLTDDQWKQAGDFGRDAFLNYDIDAKYLQYARQTVMPFASWTYAAIPMLGRIALTRPWMVANVLTSYALLDAAMAAMAGEDEEDRNKLGKMYNEKLFFNMGPNAMIRLPFLGDDQNPVYFRLGDYIPLSSTVRGTPAGFMGYEGWPGGFTPNGPLVSLAGMFLNTNTYTGKKLNDPTDSAFDVTLTNAGLMLDMFLPPMVSTRNIGKVIDYTTGEQTISGRDMTSLFAARALGLKFYDPNVTEELMYKRIEEKQLKRDYGIAVSRAKREEMRSGAPDFDRLYKEIDSLNTEMREEIDKLYGRD